MIPVLTPEEMAAHDRRAIAAGTPVATLMERAGAAVAWQLRHLLGGTYGRRVVAVCGKGNNGGDGIVAARRLREWGARVEVIELAVGVERERTRRALDRADAVVDGMFGTGFRGRLEGDPAWLADELGEAGAPVVAIDIPSGVDGLTGAVTGPTVSAAATVTFAALKPGLVLEPGRSRAGRVSVADIGIDVTDAAIGVTTGSDVWAWLPARARDAHKWSVGGVMVVGGSAGMTGAPMLVSHAAMRAGAGIVHCGVPGADAAARAAGSEVITRALPATDDGALAEPAAGAVLADADRFGALVVGPGLGRADATRAAVLGMLRGAARPVVLDADALNVLGGDLAPLRARAAPTVLTPHEGEYARLESGPPGADRVAAARRLADAARAVVLLKGPTTVIAEPDGGRVALNPTGGPWLATAGTGDVLAGIVGALLARGVPPFEAAAAAAWVHGRAADVAGHTGLVAGDLVTALPRVLADPTDPVEA